MASSAGSVLYVDTSALVKLLILEAESEAVQAELERWNGLATSSLTLVELSRAVLRAREQHREVAGVLSADELLRTLAEVPMTSRVLSVASTLQPAALRTLDAIHLASALALGADLGAVMTYDERLADSARVRDLVVVAPG